MDKTAVSVSPEQEPSQAAPPGEPEPGYGPAQWAGLLGGVLAFGVLLLMPAPDGLEPAAWRTAAVAVLMAVWWMTEALPISATALLPLVLFPLLGIATIAAAAAPFANPIVFLFLGGFVVAQGMERWELHRRIAINVIRLLGVRPPAIIAGFMLSAAFLSMWISNTATAVMMLPIALSVMVLARDRAGGSAEHFSVALMLGIAYACSLGGIATLIGTPTNAILAGFMLQTYGLEISFARWMLIGLPLTLIGLPLAFVVLTRWVFPLRIQTLPGGRALIREELDRLGAITQPEVRVALVFAGVALLWIFRPLLAEAVPGLSDAGIAMFGALLMFLVPSGTEAGRFLLTWREAERLPWGILLLFGGGLSLAAAIADTGLAVWIGEALGGLRAWPVAAVVLAVALVVVLLTELTSNVATAAAFLPVLASLAVGIGQNPLLFAIPAVMAASCAFMLPVATPPNAIVYSSGALRIAQMARAGAVLNLLFVLLITLLAFTLAQLAFGIEVGTVPDWALD